MWVGGRSYYVQGEYTQSFKDLDDREKQRLINRQKSGESPYDFISKSDRPELADVIFDNPERQALYVGDLDPNMIRSVWYNEILHKERRTNGNWVRYSRKDFIRNLGISTKMDKFFKYLPNDDFTIDGFIDTYFKGNAEDYSFQSFIKYGIERYDLKELGFYPKQIKQIMDMKSNGDFDEYIK